MPGSEQGLRCQKTAEVMQQDCCSEQRVRQLIGAPDGDEVQAESNVLSTPNLIRGTISDTVTRAMGPGLKAKSLRAVMKLSVGAAAGYGMKFVRRMILARLLAPSEIGVMAIVVGFSTAFEVFTEVGVKDSVIQNKKGAEAGYLNVTWWLQVVRGLLVSLLAILSAPWISAFYDKPELSNLLRVSFLAVLFKGLVSPRAYVLEKEYRFGRSVMLNQGSAVLGAIVTIVLAFLIRNVWALVIGFVAEMAILCLISFLTVPIVPRFRIDRQSLAELMRFARGMFGLPVLAFVSFQMPVLVLGKLIPDDQLGFYSYAAMLAYFPIMIYTKMVGPVLLPAFSKKQGDKAALCRGLLLVTRWTGVSGILLATYMACCSSELLYVIYKPEYAAMAIPFAVLCVQIIARTETAILAGVYLAVGRPHLHRRYSIARAVAVVSLIYPASVRFGALGAAGVIVFSNLIILLMQVLGCRRIIGLDFSRYVRCYVPGLLLAVPIALTFDLLWVLEVDHLGWVIGIGSLVFVAALAAGMFVVSRFERNVRNHEDPRLASGGILLDR